MAPGKNLSAAFLVTAVILLAPVAGVYSAGNCPEPVELPRAQVSVAGPATTSQFKVEIADTASARAAGLMCRRVLAEDTGMLFIYPRSQVVKMWMKNTSIPLDILFVDAGHRIVKIAANAVPLRQERIDSGTPVTMALELPAGTVERRDIRVGDSLRLEN